MKENKRILYIVCDYYHENADIDIDAICGTYYDAIAEMKKNINDFVQSYGYSMNSDMSLVGATESTYIKTDRQNYAVLYVDDCPVCEWFVKKADLSDVDANEEKTVYKIEHTLYRINPVYGPVQYVDCRTEEDLFWHIVNEYDKKGIPINSVCQICKDGTTPKVKVFTNKKYKEIRKEILGGINI